MGVTGTGDRRLGAQGAGAGGGGFFSLSYMFPLHVHRTHPSMPGNIGWNWRRWILLEFMEIADCLVFAP